jgi:hypothetical protein
MLALRLPCSIGLLLVYIIGYILKNNLPLSKYFIITFLFIFPRLFRVIINLLINLSDFLDFSYSKNLSCCCLCLIKCYFSFFQLFLKLLIGSSAALCASYLLVTSELELVGLVYLFRAIKQGLAITLGKKLLHVNFDLA